MSRRFVGSKSGNIALITALLAPLLVVLAGGVLDVSNASLRKAELQQAADATSVGVVARNSPGYQAGLKMNGNASVPDSTTMANAQAIFNANWRSPTDTTTPVISGNAQPCSGSTLVCKSGTTIYSNVTATATFHPTFLGLLSFLGQSPITAMKLTVTSKAADNIPAYTNFYLLLDNTPSMGIAATSDGIGTMVSHTPDQCAFACHDNNNSNNYYLLAKSLNVTTRIYAVSQATSNFVTLAKNTETSNGIANQFSVALYDFGAAATDPTAPGYTGLSQVFPGKAWTVSSDLSAAASAAATIDLMTVNGQGQFNDEDTNIEAPLSSLALNLPVAGNGGSPSTAKEVLVIVTDGLDDAYNCGRNDSATCRYIRPVNSTPYYPSPTICDKLKAQGVTVAVLYTAYLPLPTNSFYNTYVSPINPQYPPNNLSDYQNAQNNPIEKALSLCVSEPDFYKKVSSDGDINSAMQKLFQTLVASVRITG